MATTTTTRSAQFAGSWYSGNKATLSKELDQWLVNAKSAPDAPARGFICPHAGYHYCGPAAAYAYKALKGDVERIFVLGPSHHSGFSGCKVTSFTKVESPIGTLTVDIDTVHTLLGTKLFTNLDPTTDMEEHSLEMQFPYLARNAPTASVVPIMVGQVNEHEAAQFGEVLAKYVEQPRNVFVVSSDFCHWGRRFGYTHFNEKWADSKSNIFKSIEHLDRLGMDAIESGNPADFQAYLDQYANTICGKRAISIMMHALGRASAEKVKPKFVYYTQSSQVRSPQDSSVSYAVAQMLPQ